MSSPLAPRMRADACAVDSGQPAIDPGVHINGRSQANPTPGYFQETLQVMVE